MPKVKGWGEMAARGSDLKYLLHESLCGTLKATEASAPLVALWKEEILPIVEAFISRSR